ncbi:MAG: GDSL-type esterase/lipase family protein [Bernardetiaceae bacterium]|jgi:lysophospholipase L1-like esterase|nr:GDSL-type esterase/lipase family protein [Bernardetiaceae bacterium]
MKPLAQITRWILLAALWLGGAALAKAQPYGFINYPQNQIYQPEGRSMGQFFGALRELETGRKRKVNIVHIGDSHIQADHFSGRLRQLLQDYPKFGNGGRGFLFPYTAANTNNPDNYSVTYTGIWEGAKSIKKSVYSRWGLAAVNAITRDPRSTITINPNRHDSVVYGITKVKIFYPVFDKSSFNVSLVVNPRDLVSSYLSREGFIEYEFSRPQDRITLQFSRSDYRQNQFILQGISLENEDAGIVYSAVGINGAEVNTYFRCEDFERHLRALKPDLVVVSLGTNDAHGHFDSELFKSNCRFMVSQVRRAAPKASVLFTTPGDDYLYGRHNANIPQARARLYEVADELGTGIWDFFEVMGGPKSINSWVGSSLAHTDRVHLSIRGYRLQGELFFDALMLGYKRYVDSKRQ